MQRHIGVIFTKTTTANQVRIISMYRNLKQTVIRYKTRILLCSMGVNRDIFERQRNNGMIFTKNFYNAQCNKTLLTIRL